MKAKIINFERNIDPKESMKIGKARFKVPTGDISFVNSSTSGQGYGAGNDNPKILIVIKGKTKGRAFMKGDGMPIGIILPKPGGGIDTTGTESQKEIYGLVADFLNLPETRIKISEILEKYF